MKHPAVTIAVLALLAFFAAVAVLVSCPPRERFPAADAIIVLGSPLAGDVPGPALASRVRKAAELHEAKRSSWLILTGGLTRGSRRTESAGAARLARALGVPADKIVVEGRSQSTVENLIAARELMHGKKLRTAMIVSDPLHLRRAMMIADSLGIEASPAASDSPMRWVTQARRLAIETLAYPRDRLRLWFDPLRAGLSQTGKSPNWDQ